MHIPDGYLSPSTCAALFVVATPVWAVASRKVKRQIHTRLVPLMAVVAAFSFVVMMFNLPLPGGTTGHAVGMAIAAIVLGPWAAVIALSVALVIQAIFFGDGGVTAIGANCLNMAIVGSFVAYATYALVAGRSDIQSPRRIVAAGVAGYVGINVAALFAAVEFGVQPWLFHDASGAPLYAPYPLSIAVPAMLAGHLTLAGFAEAAASAGLVAMLQRYDPDLLRLTARRAPLETGEARVVQWRRTRALWFGIAILMVLSPAGLIAAGGAWGEWSAQDFADPAARQAISRASGGVAPPAAAPAGLQRLSGLWSPLIPDYAPGFVGDRALGYVASAIMGGGLVLLTFLALGALPRRRAALARPPAA